MNTHSFNSPSPAVDSGYGDEHNVAVRPSRLGAVGESSLASGIISVASVALVNGSPRLAVRAAYAVVHDSYSSRRMQQRCLRRRRRGAQMRQTA
ncbi:MAG TPA: hypothetical protein VL979_13645 [Solirubrobacteraceae bacterium]|nr:hypothetical protein [Solirubrobacteraceae bacterium]